MTIRSNKKHKPTILQDPIGIDKEGNEISLLDILGTDCDTVLDEVEKKLQTGKLYKIMDKVLKKRERIVLELRYGFQRHHKDPAEIAQMLDITFLCLKDRKEGHKKLSGVFIEQLSQAVVQFLLRLLQVFSMLITSTDIIIIITPQTGQV